MMDNIEIKLATIEDLSSIEQVEDGLFDYAIKPDRTKEFLNDSRHHLILAYFKDNIVGMASAFHYVHPDKDLALFMNEVGVLKKYQNRGIGRAMVRLLYEHAKVIGCKEVWVATKSSNTAARKAFTAAGGVEDNEPVVLITFGPANNSFNPDGANNAPPG
jgi:ribosomal protein S18 acetylase RimI-like enzyme